MHCKHVDCLETPVAKVSGGVEARQVNLSAFGSMFRTGWSGEYCADHVVTCVTTQLFQVEQGLPIIIQSLR